MTTVKVPQYWFNAYPDADSQPKPHEFRPGLYQIHFVSNRDGLRPDRMTTWLEISEKQLPEYDVPVENTVYLDEINNFWKDISERRTAKGIKAITEEDLEESERSSGENGGAPQEPVTDAASQQ